MSRPDPVRLRVDLDYDLGDVHLDLNLEAGTETLVLFGPSGAGKTTLLNAVAGLATPDGGEIRLDDRVFFRRRRPGPSVNLPPRRRRLGYVFQHYALFPHLTALENVAFPLGRSRGGRARGLELLEGMDLAHLAGRYPGQMSGGQQQRVAIARALATDPQALLLDEPFSALDVTLRERFQRDLRELQTRLGLVVLYVTHSLDHAFAVGQRLAVLQQGRIRQIGPVEEVFRFPADRQVAEIMGIRNLFRARVLDATPESLLLDWAGLHLQAPLPPATVQGEVAVYIRPEDIKLIYPDRPVTRAVAHNQVTGHIRAHLRQAGHQTLRVSLENDHEVEVRFPGYAYIPLALAEGAPIRLALRQDSLVVLQPPGSREDG